jgi:peptidoglycan biosynthesis protein MviN/MurJ (putative lipid II flippase)
MRRRLSQVGSAVVVLLFLAPSQGLAQWVSWYKFGTEGSYVHETAHLLFFCAMLFFIHEIFQAHLQKFRGFRCLVWAWVLLAIWNVDAFIGHWADWTLYNPVILGEGWDRRILMDSFQTWLVYITKIDHSILLIPAFLLFYLGLRALVHKPGAE